MMRLSLPALVLLNVAVHFGLTAGDGCSAGAVSAPIQDVKLPNGLVFRGAAIGVGTPPQTLAMSPSPYLNNSWVYNNGWCIKGYSNSYCSLIRGGLFNATSSTTFKLQDSSNTSNIETYGDDQLPPAQWAQDTLTVNSNSSLSNYVIGEVPDNATSITEWTLVTNTVGLGLKSSFLSAMVSSGTIASKTWSMFYGLIGGYRDAQMAGSLVFGGYDRAKVTGNNYTASLSPDLESCPSGMLVSISSLALNFPNGSSPDLISSRSDQIPACIDPLFATIMSLPSSPYYGNFEGLTQTSNIGEAHGLNFGGTLYPSNNVYQGGLTITLTSGLSVQVPNSQLVVPSTSAMDDGSISSNYSLSEVQINILTDYKPNQLITLGRSFLSAAYLMVNHDEHTFTLWQAKPTTDEDLVAIGGASDCAPPPSGASSLSSVASLSNAASPSTVASPSNAASTPHVTSSLDAPSSSKGVSSQTATPSPTSTSQPQDAQQVDKNEQMNLSVGAIVGIGVGGLVGASALVGIIIYCSLARRRRTKPAASYVTTQTDWTGSSYNGMAAYNKHPMHNTRPHEISGDGRYEMSGERAWEMMADRGAIELDTKRATRRW